MAEQAKGKVDGAQKAAIFLMALGEATAAEVLRHIGPKEVQQVGVAMAALENVSKDTVQAALDEFIDYVKTETGLAIGNHDYIRNVLVGALGENKAGGMIDRILLGGNTKGLDSLKWMESRSIVELIREEHPQVIAIVLSYLDSDQAAEVLSEFPEKVRADLLVRIATMDGIQPDAMQELNDMLEQQLHGRGSVRSSGIGGAKAAANILNFVDMESGILAQIKEVDTNLGQEIEDLMFVFEHLVDVDDRGIQTLLREISTDNLVLALKGADDKVREKMFSCMSQRAAEMLKDDLEAKGPVRLSEVEAAQKEILSIARRLADEGHIALGSAGGEEMI
jgi:flagellar motor switch protein FliG